MKEIAMDQPKLELESSNNPFYQISTKKVKTLALDDF
jgi:hypothetical protein